MCACVCLAILGSTTCGVLKLLFRIVIEIVIIDSNSVIGNEWMNEWL